MTFCDEIFSTKRILGYFCVLSIVGTIPPELGKMTDLDALKLQENILTGIVLCIAVIILAYLV